MKTIIEKAGVLIEAMPYIRSFRGAIVVIKFGGSAMEDKTCHDGILADAAFMECAGLKPVIVHGGGKAISRRMAKEGIQPVFINGLRVTDAAGVRLVEEVLNHEVNVELVETLIACGAQAAGIQGPSILRAEKFKPLDPRTRQPVDLGFVGKVVQVDTAPVQACLEAGLIPVITPLGRDSAGNVYNINADDAAGALAQALKARKLVFLSDVPGLMKNPKDPHVIMSTVSRREVEDLIRTGVIDGGMLPKIQGALDALAAGVGKIHIIDGRLPHSLLLEIFTDKGIGTEIVQ
ncbi:MAG: acetylglutamate kinase [Verrucomicrobia bacterium]|nr:acetylglutamate kinase [Verrucomicrobiota bacterium]MCG2679203.1 acetylglutamate kinase [Kiritimatiellia bacterium]MBU4248596.1 acetylglutamate kinase [Verrucomicrobiota bacterium]MBU4290058.1 acetylglutamate kinase [Verrucomicrobiota bacterium]MBU4428920.1 acetylglutamate kinase [Verrucomicrobiota bacterium]